MLKTVIAIISITLYNGDWYHLSLFKIALLLLKPSQFCVITRIYKGSFRYNCNQMYAICFNQSILIDNHLYHIMLHTI